MMKHLPLKMKLSVLAIVALSMAISTLLLMFNRVVSEDYIFILVVYAVLMIATYRGLALGLILSLAAVLVYGGYHFYAIYIASTQTKLADKDVIFMILFPLTAIAGGYLGESLLFIEKLFQRYLSQIESLVFTGHLGMIQTPEAFQQSLKEECSRARRALSQFSLVLLDIANMDQLQKLFGMDAQGEAARKISETLARNTRDIDKKARLEETLHALILTDTSKEEAEKVLERIQDRLARIEMDYRGRSIKTAVSLALGRAVFPQDGKSDTELMAAAKRVLKEGESNTIPYAPRENSDVSKKRKSA